MGRIGLVIFDCDGVLIDSESIAASTLVGTLGQHGVGIDLPYVAQHFLGRAFPTVHSTILRDFDVTLPTGFEADFRTNLHAAFTRDLRAMVGIFDVLQGMTLPWCVATSSSRVRADHSLALAGLDGLVQDRLFTSDMVLHGKPAPDLFFLAAASMGVAPDACLVIEDSPNGILAAKAAGMRVWQFTGGAHMAGQPPSPLVERSFSTYDRFLQEIAA